MSQPTYSTKCKLCGKEFIVVPLDMPHLNEPIDPRILSMEDRFARHLHEKHEKEWQELVGIAATFSRVLLLRVFDTQDPAIMKAEDIARWQVHQMTRKNPPPIDSALDAEELKRLRDYLIESDFIALNSSSNTSPATS
jgi:hypothetical protein